MNRLLAIDISNTGIKFGLYGPDRMETRWRIATVRDRTADEYAMLLIDLLAHRGYRLQDIRAIIISSVVPVLTPVFQEVARQYCDTEAVVVDYSLDVGVRLAVDNPWETGTDRIMSALAAHQLYGGPAIVIQFGTATSFDVVSADGAFLGGAIAPGLGISADALTRAASQLYQVPFVAPPSALGKNTIHSMQSGIIYGHVGLVEGVVARLRRELPGGDRAHVIAHGGLADVVAAATPIIEVVNHNLILEGLRLAYLRLCPEAL
jgi:type III pantothenate kinase